MGIRHGGRQKGVLNKRTVEVLERLEQLGCDPVEGLAQIAMDAGNSVEIRLRAYSELAPYVAAKRKAIDLNVESAVPMHIQLVSFSGQ